VDRCSLRWISSTAELRQQARAWNDLWQRSACPRPTALAEPLAVWIDHFAPRRPLRILVLEQHGQWVAAVPLIVRRRARLLRVAELPGNEWSPAGDLLLDPLAASADLVEHLLGALLAGPWQALALGGFDASRADWQQLAAAAAGRRLVVDQRANFQVGRVAIAGRWDDYLASRSRNHRRQMRVAERRAGESGATELVILAGHDPDHRDSTLRRAFAVEDRSWKGGQASSVLRVAGMLDFYRQQAHALADAGSLRVVALALGGEWIAAEYGWLAKGVYVPLKVGYDEAYARLTPGQLLRWRLLEQFHQQEDVRAIDFIGPLADATARWSNQVYSCGKLLLAPRSAAGAALRALVRCRRTTQHASTPTSASPAAAGSGTVAAS
jgi:CelD/BcsL family acetyltransferase involved in cellulose biosynthesis